MGQNNLSSSIWLLKTEPTTYSFEQLIKEKSTNWNNIRNYQARNFLREMKVGDTALIYHSGEIKAVVGIAKIIKEAYPDPDKDGKDWLQVDIQAVKPLKTKVTLAQIKATKELSDLLLIKQSRLSVMPITATHFNTIVNLGT